jgi:glutaredoxin|tara:strand:- start:364 stop:687 length:324 start_codon:yes stop_codon:yes gene_type:complete
MTGQWQGGKGSKRRPENKAAIDANWDLIFRSKMKVTIYGKDNCPYCDMAKKLSERKGYDTTYKKLGQDFDALEMARLFPNARTFPQIIADGKAIGGYTEFEKDYGNI